LGRRAGRGAVGDERNSMDLRRSGWLTYAAVIMFIAAGLSAIWAINLWADAAWLSDVSNGILGDEKWLWGLLDIAMAIVFVYAGKSLLEGNDFGRWVAVIVASIGILRWFYWMPFAPFLALTIIAILFLVLYAVLVTWGDEAGGSRQT
jgi:hypothetical protein